MKSWRRSSSTSSSTVAPPEIISAVDVGGGGAAVDVTFDQPVTWTGGTLPEFEVDGNAGDAVAQITASKIRIDIPAGFGGGASYHWASPAPNLTPVPDSSQTGLVT